MEKNKIFVSVLMSVYSEPVPMLKEAIDSILNQTFQNLEFLVYLDNPDNDEIWNLLKEYKLKDDRLIIHRNEKNRFLAGTLNDELQVAKGDYIVRMDGDDISVPNRIACLVDYMEKHPQVGVASSWMKEFGHKRKIDNRIVRYESDFEKMKVNYLCQTPIAHAPCIIRREVVDKFGPALFNERCCKTQDYELWSRLIRAGVVFGMVNKPLYLRRSTQGAGSNPITFQVIHNQIARKNMSDVLAQKCINLPDQVDEEMISQVRNVIGQCSGLQKRQIQMIQCILYSNVYSSPARRLLKMIVNGDTKCLWVLSLRTLFHFCRSGKLTEMNNIVTSSTQLIY